MLIYEIQRPTNPSVPVTKTLELMDLPVELVFEIFDHLPDVDLKSARLTCKALAGIAVPRLFRRVYFGGSLEEAMEWFERTRHRWLT